MRLLLILLISAIGTCSLWSEDLALKVIITNHTSDQCLLTVVDTNINKEESVQLMAPGEIVNMVLKWGYYRISFGFTLVSGGRTVVKTVAVDRSTLANVSNTCVAVTLTQGLYPGEPYIGFSAVCAPPAAPVPSPSTSSPA